MRGLGPDAGGGRAAEERRAGMGLHDRFLYAAAQAVAGHPAARAFVCCYALLLHFLVPPPLPRARARALAHPLCAGSFRNIYGICNCI